MNLKWGVLKRTQILLQLREFRSHGQAIDQRPGHPAEAHDLDTRRAHLRQGKPIDEGLRLATVRVPYPRVGRKSQGVGYRMLAEPQKVAKRIPREPAEPPRGDPWAPARTDHRDGAEALRSPEGVTCFSLLPDA